jgi:uncharacterized protein YyaL (SSP411 family)
MARAALALHEATGDAALLDVAIRLANVARDRFGDGAGGFFTTAADAADVPGARPRTAADNATPYGPGLMAEVLARLYHLTGVPDWRERAAGVPRAFSGQTEQLSGMPTLLAAADLLEEAATVVVAGAPDAAAGLWRAALSAPDPAIVVVRIADPAGLPPDHPAHGKPVPVTGAAAYLCRRNRCGLPFAEPAALAQALRTRG